ncbi:response regulator [Fibrella sp. WM1]|uniref:response regulator n=1 Tax=Fibrella musci TaxID=3242485 RepID=UPI003522F179
MKSILVIEDNAEMRENIAEMLELASYTVIQAGNGKQGVQMARRTQPDLILCDVMMPELDGYGVLQILSNDPLQATTPFLFLSAKADSTDFRFGMNLGADDYLTKPFDDVTLLNAVELRLKKGERKRSDAVASPANLANLTQAILNESTAQQELSDYYPTAHYRKKQQLFTVGSLPMSLFFVIKGKIKVSRLNQAGNEYITALVGAGEFIGYVDLLKGGSYAETAEALDDVTVVTILKADFLELIGHHQGVAAKFIHLLVNDVVEHQKRLLNLAYQSVRKRVAEALLMFQEKFYSPSVNSEQSDLTQLTDAADVPGQPSRLIHKPAGTVLPPMTLSRDNWSHLVGASTETVIRILSDFRSDRLIDISSHQITLLNVGKLAELRQ